MKKDQDGNTRVLPSGLVTFVFTDIEGSTRLYKALGESAAQAVFDTHNEVLRASWDAHHGYEVHTEGDSFFVVFEDPNDAVTACVDVQRRLAATRWPAGGEVNVRIGIHCGLAAPRHDDYMSLGVHQAARVMSAANGGQVLITDDILSRLDPRDDCAFTRTGSFRLRDFDEAPVLHRVDGVDVPIFDRAPRATPATHHNLVPRLTSFVGRDDDVAAVTAALVPGKAVTVVGLGGMGKTRLATEIGLQVASRWEHGAWMIELADIADPDLIADEVAAAIGVDKASVGDRWNDVTDFIGDKAMLLIVDNVEHQVEELAQRTPEILRSCPNVAVLCTSREPLNCEGELIYRLEPLELSQGRADVGQLPSVELFIDRAQAVATDTVWTDQAVDDVLEICRHLDGLPLAIEIAAAQVAVLTLSEIREGLNNRFRLLRSRDRALPARQRTMEGLLGWSYRLLDDNEQRAFRRLAVFAGSFSIDAAEAALADDVLAADDVPELIWTLVDKSLIAADVADSATRYRLLESVQRYAMRLLIDHDDPVRSAVALGDWLLEQVAPWRVNDRRWLGDVAIELANIRTVVDLIGDNEPEKAQQLMCSVGRYHDTIQAFDVGVDELTRAASQLQHSSPARVALLGSLADLHLRTANIDDAAHVLREATEVQAETGSAWWNDVAVERPEGEILSRSGDHGAAAALAERTLTRELSSLGAGRMWNLLGIARFALGEPEAGLEAFRAELASYEAMNHAPNIGSAHGNVAEAAWRLGDIERAAEHQHACLNQAIALGQPVLIAYSLVMAAQLAGRRENWEQAIQLQTCAEKIVQQAGHNFYADDERASRELVARARAALTEDAVDAAVAAGSALATMDAAVLAAAEFRSVADTAATTTPKLT